MLRSLYSAVSGVKAHQTYLDVTGNNIANVNTVGFKRDVIHFRDMIYQTMRGASAPDNGVPIGGINPAQVGLGVKVGSIETVHTGGSLQSTGVPTDMAISGEGYFVVQNGGRQLYTRAGNFALDRDGNLTMSGNGYKVQGYAYREQVDPATGNVVRVRDTNLTGINIPIGQKIPAKATTLAAFRCNLCSTASPEIPDLNSIPGGEKKVPRPHDYSAYGSLPATYVGAGAPAAGVEGDTYFDGTELKFYNAGTATWDSYVPPKTAGPEDLYYGKNTAAAAAGVFTNVFESAGGAITGPFVKARVIVDGAGGARPTAPSKPGETFLDTTGAGTIHTANADGTAWLAATTPAVAGTAYASRPAPGAIYVLDSTNAMAAVTHVMDETSGAKNVFTWNGVKWSNINDSAALSPSVNSTTTQATIDRFGESMIKSHDHETKMDVYDSLGNVYTMATYFRKVLDRPGSTDPVKGAEAEWDWYTCYLDKDGKPLEAFGEGAGTLVFGDDGLLKRTYYYEPTPATPDPMATKTTQPVYNWSVVEKIIGDPAYESVATGKVVADFNVVGAEGKPILDADGKPVYSSNMITLDFLGERIEKVLGVEKEPIDGVTQFGSPSTTKGYFQDGYAMGELNDWSVGGDGIITGIYSNGRNLPIAQVALAMFANPGGLTKVGETCFAESSNSGIAQIGPPRTGGAGTIEGSTIEMSNVDLSEEFVNLIKAQRGFQANTRVVTTSDQVLEELINMKR